MYYAVVFKYGAKVEYSGIDCESPNIIKKNEDGEIWVRYGSKTYRAQTHGALSK